jgi:cobalt-zinc-cadmium efflux system membrane fusion protein
MLFENEAGKINLNQDVEFRILSKPDEIIKASIYKIGKSIDNETKSVISFAWIDKNVQARLINNTFVDAEIKTDIRTITALPTEAVVKTSIGNFVLVLEKLDAKNYYFRKEKIETGLSSETFIEVKTGLVNKNVLTKGAFNLIVE